jgi:hypothetical protein
MMHGRTYTQHRYDADDGKLGTHVWTFNGEKISVCRHENTRPPQPGQSQTPEMIKRTGERARRDA